MKPVSIAFWRILVLDEPKNNMHSRAFSSQPSAHEIEQVILGVLQDQSLPSIHIYIPATIEKLCPGLQEKLMSRTVAVYPPPELSGGRVAVIPYLADVQLKIYYHPIAPAFMRMGGGSYQ